MLYAGMAHVLTLDMGVSVFMGLTLCAFLLAQRDGATPRATRNWMWLAWAAMGLAVLSKGLQGVVLPGAVLVLHSLIERDFALWKRLHIVSGLAIFLAVAAPWFVAVSLANPEFFQFFFIHEHFERFLTKAHQRYRPFWYFVPILLLGMLPWMIVMFDALATAWRREPGSRFQPKRFLLIWAGFIFVFFSASSSKLPSYILPMFPALALLIGARLTEMPARRLAWLAGPVMLAAAAGLGISPFLERFASDEVLPPLFVAYMPWLIVACVTLGTGIVFALLIDRTGQRELAVLALSAGGLGFAQLVLTGHDSFAPSQSAYHLVEEARQKLAGDRLLDRPEVPFYSVGFYEQTLPFYIKRTVTLVAHRDEMDFGIIQEPQKFVPTIEEFERRWRTDREALAIVQPYRYRDFKAAGLPMQLIAEDTRRVIIRKPQAPARSP
jgi:4-amino-4-deoxy-L-arabinose transferase-like glycosyltransferase